MRFKLIMGFLFVLGILIVGMFLINSCTQQQTSQSSQKECSEDFPYSGCTNCNSDKDCENFCNNLCKNNGGTTNIWTGYPATQFGGLKGEFVCSCTCWYC